MVAKFKAITPELLKIDRIRLEVLNGLRKFGNAALRDVKKITDPWDGDSPNWNFKISLAGGKPAVFIDPGSGAGADKWLWLDEGTDVRFAVMTPGFVSKTQPGVLSSGSGQGGLFFVNTNIERPGIKARGWTQILLKQWEPVFQKIMQDSLDKGARVSGNAI